MTTIWQEPLEECEESRSTTLAASYQQANDKWECAIPMTDEALTPGFLCSGMWDVNNRYLNLTASCSATLSVAIRNKDETVTIHVSYRSFKLILPVTGILIASQDLFIYLVSLSLPPDPGGAEEK